MEKSETLVRFRLIPLPVTSKADVEALAAAVRKKAAYAEIEESNSFIGIGEVAVALAIVATISEAAKVISEIIDRIKGESGFTIDARERPPLLVPNPALPSGVVFTIKPDGSTETLDNRSSATQLLSLLLGGS